MINDDTVRWREDISGNPTKIRPLVDTHPAVATDPDADEVAAETFAIAWRRIDDVPSDPLPWLIGVARRVLANRRRGERRAGALVARLGLERAVCAPDPAELVGDRTLGFALATLSARDREILALVAWEGLTTAEVATALGITTAMASARLHRARTRLRRALADEPGPVVERLEEGR